MTSFTSRWVSHLCNATDPFNGTAILPPITPPPISPSPAVLSDSAAPMPDRLVRDYSANLGVPKGLFLKPPSAFFLSTTGVANLQFPTVPAPVAKSPSPASIAAPPTLRASVSQSAAHWFRGTEDALRAQFFGGEEITLYRKMTQQEFADLQARSTTTDGKTHYGPLQSKLGKQQNGDEQPRYFIRETPLYRWWIHCQQGVMPECQRNTPTPWISFTGSQGVLKRYLAMDQGFRMDNLPAIEVKVPRFRAFGEPMTGDDEYLIRATDKPVAWRQVTVDELRKSSPYPAFGSLSQDGYYHGMCCVYGIGPVPMPDGYCGRNNIYDHFPPPPGVEVWVHIPAPSKPS